VNTSVSGLNGLDIFTFGNVESSKICCPSNLCFNFYVLDLLCHQSRDGTMVDNSSAASHRESHAKSVQARTILLTGIPKRCLTNESLYRMFNTLPGGVEKIWINRDLRELPDVYDRRMDLTAKLESAETALIRKSVQLRVQSSDTSSSKTQDIEASPSDSSSKDVPTLPEEERPTLKLGFLGLFGEKVERSVRSACLFITT